MESCAPDAKVVVRAPTLDWFCLNKNATSPLVGKRGVSQFEKLVTVKDFFPGRRIICNVLNITRGMSPAPMLVENRSPRAVTLAGAAAH